MSHDLFSSPTNPAAPGDWMKNPDFLAVMGHIGWGAIVMLTTGVLAHTGHHPWAVMGWVQLALAGLIGFKEAWIDPRYESGENLLTGLGDWAGWMAGSALAWAVVYAGAQLGAWSS